MFTFSPLGPVPQPSGQVHRRFPLEDSSPLQTCTSGLSLSSASQKFFSLSTAISPFPFHPSGCGHKFIHTVLFPCLITRPPCCQPCLPIVSPRTAPLSPGRASLIPRVLSGPHHAPGSTSALVLLTFQIEFPSDNFMATSGPQVVFCLAA